MPPDVSGCIDYDPGVENQAAGGMASRSQEPRNPAHQAGTASQSDARRASLLIDCDTGIDDSLALLYAVASPDCEIVAVTCTAGNVDAGQVAENTRAVLELAGRADVEVAVGRDRPLARPLVTTPETHGPRGIGYATLPPASAPLSPRFGPDLIVAEARRRPGELTLVTLAPLTNVALALQREPELPRLLRRCVIMGGSYRSAGNTAPTTEWNVSCDPEAAGIVFEAFELEGPAGRPARPTALGLDVTERAKLLPEHLARLAAPAGCASDGSVLGAITGSDGGPSAVNPIVRYLADALRFYMEFHSRYDGFYGAFIHDPLALAAALDPTLVRTEAVTVDVELDGRLTTGETVTDWRRVWGRPPNVDVAISADIDRFFERFIERVGALAARTAAEPAPLRPGEEVVLDLSRARPPDLMPDDRGRILSIHDDETRDYPWCLVRLSDGREVELPQAMVRRPID
jgi:purine nucleosidase